MCEYYPVFQLLDLVILDVHSLRFKKSVLAAAALYHTCSVPDICAVTGLAWADIEPCIDWMKIHQDLILKHRPYGVAHKPMDKISEVDTHKIQYNTVPKELWVSLSLSFLSLK